MSTEKPIITKAVVELTFAGGTTRRYVLDDVDEPIDFDLFAETDMVDTSDEQFRRVAPGPRRRVKVHLFGRGPAAVPAVTAGGSDQEAAKEN